MFSAESLCNELPFATLSDDVLMNSIVLSNNLDSNNGFPDLFFDTLLTDYDKYNNVDRYNSFNTPDIPKTEYVYLSNLSLPSNNTLSILNLNIRSIPKNLQYFVDNIMHNSSFKLNIIGFTEIRLNPGITSLYNLPGYQLFVNTRNVYGGGVAIYVESELEASLLQELTISFDYIETVCIEVSNLPRKSLNICVYRPPNGNFANFCDTLSNILSSAYTKKYSHINIFGDFNINLLTQNDNTDEFVNLMYSFSLFPLITRPTRITNTSATLIDHIWTTQLDMNIGNYVIDTDISDHFPVISQFKTRGIRPKKQIIKQRFITPSALQNFLDELSLENWYEVINSSCPKESFNIFYNIYLKLFDKHFPIQIRKQSLKKEISPHITPALKASITEKNRLERLARKWPLTYRERYKKYRNKLTTLLRTAKNLYYKQQLIDNQGDPKKQWKVINSLLGKTSSVGKANIELNPPSMDIPNAINEHFLKSYNNNTSLDYRNYLVNAPVNSMYMLPTDTVEVKRHLNILNTNAPGYDDIPPTLLKASSDLISVPLTHTINLSLTTGYFPDQLKQAKVVPVFKSGDKMNINNYRPISILPAFSKIYEKIICSRLVSYLEDNNILVKQQHGFRSQHSTESAILHFLTNVYKYLEEKHFVVGIFVDLSKAFDTIDHNILLYKLNHIGIRGTTGMLFQSYLSNRRQSVYCNNKCSPVKLIDRGVPQGSILGPILFLIYVNDMINASSKIDFTFYADDTTLVMKDINIDNLHETVTNELSNIDLWIKSNNLKLNINKTNYIFFQNRSRNHIFPNVFLNGEQLTQVHSTKFLGVKIDQNLNWKIHINEICLKLSKLTGILYRIRHNLTEEAKLSIYYTLLYPHLSYCVSLWASTWPSFLIKLQVSQNKFFRCIFHKKKFDSTHEIYQSRKILKISSIHKYFTMLLVFKTFGSDSVFKLREHSCNTRSNNVNLSLPIFRTKLFKNSVVNFGAEFFNTLPQNIKILLRGNDIISFKKKTKSYLLDIQN